MDGGERQNYAAEIRIRAERKVGEMLADAELSKGGRPSDKTATTMGGVSLADLGINHNASSRWQLLASIPGERLPKRNTKHHI